MDQKFSAKLRLEGVSEAAIALLQEQEFETEEDLSKGFTYEHFLAMGIKAKSARILADLFPSSNPTRTQIETPGVVRFLADLPENLSPAELIDRVMNALERKEEPDKKYVDELRKRFPGTYFVRNLKTDQLDPTETKGLIAQVGTRRPPSVWKGVPLETIDQILARKIYADPFTGAGIYDETNMWLQLTIEEREVIIYLREIKRVSLDPVNTHTQLLTSPRSHWWEMQITEWQSLKKKTDSASLHTVAQVQSKLYLQEGGQRTSTIPFENIPIVAVSQVKRDTVNILVLYHQKQYGHYQALADYLDTAVFEYNINVIGVSNESHASFNREDLEHVQICLLLMSPALISWLGRDGYDLRHRLQEAHSSTNGVRVVPIKVAPYEQTAMVPFAQLSGLPRDGQVISATDGYKWTEVSKEIKRIYLPIIARIQLSQMNFEQMRQLCGLLNIQPPYTEADTPTTIQQVLAEYNGQRYGYALEHVVANIALVQRHR